MSNRPEGLLSLWIREKDSEEWSEINRGTDPKAPHQERQLLAAKRDGWQNTIYPNHQFWIGEFPPSKEQSIADIYRQQRSRSDNYGGDQQPEVRVLDSGELPRGPENVQESHGTLPWEST